MSYFKATPRGLGNIGVFGDGVDADMMRAGNRAQRRFMAKHDKQQARKDALPDLHRRKVKAK